MIVFAYLDAGSGSLLLQAILGGLAGIAVAFRAFKAKVRGKAVDEAVAVTKSPDLPTEGS